MELYIKFEDENGTEFAELKLTGEELAKIIKNIILEKIDD